MMTIKPKTEASYRAIRLDSSSSLKEFSLNRKKYHKKYILSEDVEDEDTKATTMGRIVETLLMEPKEFENRFYMSVCISTPTGLMLEFVEALYKHTKEATDEEGNVTKSFEELSRSAYADSGFKIKYDAVIGKFVGSDAEVYYNEIRQVRSRGLIVIGSEEINIAQRIVDELKSNPFTCDIVNLSSNSRYEVVNQFQVEGYSVNSHLFKSMLDKVIIDHQEKKIWIYDLKCVWAVEGFYEEYYLYRRAYIQAYLYTEAIRSLTIDSQSNLSGYDVQYPRFIVCDSTNYYSPLVYTTSYLDLKDAYEGFEHKGRTYPGVKQLIKDLDWAIQNDIWNISRQNYIANGLINIKGC